MIWPRERRRLRKRFKTVYKLKVGLAKEEEEEIKKDGEGADLGCSTDFNQKLLLIILFKIDKQLDLKNLEKH